MNTTSSEISERKTAQELLIEFRAVMGCVKWLKKQIQAEKPLLAKEQAEAKELGKFEDCGEFYTNAVIRRKARMEALIETKISLEKHARKLRHQARETSIQSVQVKE